MGIYYANENFPTVPCLSNKVQSEEKLRPVLTKLNQM